ncbi:MAG: ATP synthase F1 subunit gamma [Clostridia bacterium]|nr:ATP synthase F1 subunit gamma [Clostridia bacterium]
MSQNIKQLRGRIKSIDSTLHLTKAMGLVASSKIRKATETMQKSLEYSEAFRETVKLLAGCHECKASPYMAPRKEGVTCLVVIAGDRGLAGGYNANVFRLLREYPEARIIPIGKRACERFREPILSAEHFSYRQARELAERLCREFTQGEIARVGILGTRYRSLMSQEPYVRLLLPLEAEAEKEARGYTAIFEPDEMTVLNAMVPDYLASTILSCVRESFASEVAARRVAMDNAEKNAREMIDTLQLEYNRARQSSITQEITEIVAGSGSEL